jgi:hypothetical protein
MLLLQSANSLWRIAKVSFPRRVSRCVGEHGFQRDEERIEPPEA